jgi:hypothetical protein
MSRLYCPAIVHSVQHLRGAARRVRCRRRKAVVQFLLARDNPTPHLALNYLYSYRSSW